MSDAQTPSHASTAARLPAGAVDPVPGRRPGHAVRYFVVGLVLWLVTVATTSYTGNVNLVPTVVLLGSFLVPVVFVLSSYEHLVRTRTDLTFYSVVRAFVVGGVLGVLAASVLEGWVIRGGPFQYVAVGVIEELVKALALVVVARHLPHHTMRDGLVLGGAVGFGFAAFESSGYAFTALLSSSSGLALGSTVETEVLRGFLAPFGHGLWTAVLGAVLFRAASRHGGRFRVTGAAVGAYLVVVVLHALWDSMSYLAVLVALLLTLSAGEPLLLDRTGLRLTPEQAHLATWVQWGGQALVALVGVVVWLLVRRAAHREERVRDLPLRTPASPWS